MSDKTSHRRAASFGHDDDHSAEELAAAADYFPLIPYEAPKTPRKASKRKGKKPWARDGISPADAERARKAWAEEVERINIAKRFQVEVIESLSGYFHKRSNMAIALGALQPSDRDWYEALMGDAALRALPYFNPDKGVKRSTFLIQAVENFLVDNSRYENRKKRKAITTPITAMDIVEANARGMASEDGLEDTSKGGWKRVFFEMDAKQFYESLTPFEDYYLQMRLDGLSLTEIAEIAGYSLNTFRRRIWSVIQTKAVRFGGMEGRMIEV